MTNIPPKHLPCQYALAQVYDGLAAEPGIVIWPEVVMEQVEGGWALRAWRGEQALKVGVLVQWRSER